MLPKAFYCLIATLNACSILTNTCSAIFVARIYNIRNIVYYRILATESISVTLLSLISFIVNLLHLLGHVEAHQESWSCALLCGTTTVSVVIGLTCSAMASFYRLVFRLWDNRDPENQDPYNWDKYNFRFNEKWD